MEHEPIITPMSDNQDLEDGEISSSDDGYMLLARPEETKPAILANPTASTASVMEDGSDDTDYYALRERSESESSGSDNDSFNKIKKKATKVKIRPIDQMMAPKQSRHNKYNIWCSGLQEETLTQNLRSCDVTADKSKYSRDVESYDYSIKYRLNGENSLKRRQSNSDDSSGSNPGGKRMKSSNPFSNHNRFKTNRKGSVKDRLGPRRISDDSSNSNDSARITTARDIKDLVVTEESTDEQVANDIANKLCEEKDDLMLRVVTVLSKKEAIDLFLQTQKIEKDGGMMIMNGMRRRTPGGVFLHLLKNHADITNSNKKLIFLEERKALCKEKKKQKNKHRDMKVEELKKTLNNDKDLPSRKEVALSHLKPEALYGMSNPPPSPVTDCNRENSSDFDSHNIQHVNVTSPEKPQPKELELVSYDDDILDMHCDDMEMF